MKTFLFRHLPACLLGYIFCAPAHSQSFDYVNLLNPQHTLSIQISPPIFSGGDRASNAAFCEQGEKYVCISSEPFSFAVPRGEIPNNSAWTHNGHLYRLIREGATEIYGRPMKVWVIESVQDKHRFFYVYSRSHGLLAISSEIDGEKQSFISRKLNGFGLQRPKATTK